MRRTLTRLAATLMLCLAAVGAAAEGCRTIGTYGRGEDRATVKRTPGGLLAFRADVDVNTDGALTSYKMDDLGFFVGKRLTTHTALNTICNGVNIRDAAGRVVLDYRNCGALIREFERIRAFDWQRPGENYVDFYAIARRPGPGPAGVNRGFPCEHDGYYVSQTARPMDPSRDVCDPERWIDALRIPAIVMPMDQAIRATGARLFDLVAVRQPGSGRWVGAVIGDTNPNKIGEGTVRLLQELRQDPTVPPNYRAVVDLALPAADYVVFPGTANDVANRTNESAPAIARAVEDALRRHGLSGDSPPLCP